MAKIKLSIIGQDKIAYEGEANSVFVPTQTGVIEVLPEHMQLISALKPGEIVMRNDKGEQKWKVISGVLEVRTHSNVVILADIIKEE